MTNKTTNRDDKVLAVADLVQTRESFSSAFLLFVEEATNAVTPETFDPKAQWAIRHDNTCDYNTHAVLNIDNKNTLDSEYKFLTGPDGAAQQVLLLMGESTPANKQEAMDRETLTKYIRTWLDLMHAFYTNFLAGVTIDEEDFDDKYVRVRSELISQTNKTIIDDYVEYMKEWEDWSPEDVERFLAGDDPLAEIPESFSQSYYAELDLLD